MARKQRFFKSELVKILIIAAKQFTSQVIIQSGAPVLAGVSNIPISEPLWQV